MGTTKKLSNIADWAKKQTVEIESEVGMIYDLKNSGHIDAASSSASYARPICRDICDRMRSLLRTIINLGMNSVNYGPFLRVMDAYNNADHFLNNELLCDVNLFTGKITSSKLRKNYDKACDIFRCLRNRIDEVTEDVERESKEE